MNRCCHNGLGTVETVMFLYMFFFFFLKALLCWLTNESQICLCRSPGRCACWSVQLCWIRVCKQLHLLDMDYKQDPKRLDCVPVCLCENSTPHIILEKQRTYLPLEMWCICWHSLADIHAVDVWLIPCWTVLPVFFPHNCSQHAVYWLLLKHIQYICYTLMNNVFTLFA